MIACPRCGTENPANARFCNSCASPLAAPSVAEARKTVTVLFMDAVGSTGIGERSDPESMRRVMTRYFDEIRRVVERHGGTVEKYIGDAVMAVFGVPVVHEDDALRAVRAAAEIRHVLEDVDEQLHRERGLTVSWRTGINTGEVVAGDAGAGQRFVSGDAVNVAARLEQAARPGEILLGPETYGLVRDAATIEPLAPISAKGKAEPVAAYRLIDIGLGSAGQARRIESPMVGRQRQRRQLAEAYEQVVDERVCHLFTILGAAGVGKSRLVSEFLAEQGNDALVLHGRCLSYGEGITFWPVAEAFRQAADLAEDDDDETIRRKIGELIDNERDRPPVVERIGALLGRFDGKGVAEETFWAVRTLLGSLARRRPVVLVLDDLHWAEPTLLDLVEQLTDETTDAPLLLICVARQELLETRPSWGGGRKYATTLTLEPLNEGESHELMLNLFGRVELGAELEVKISAAAEGNPLFVEEMVGMLIDNGHLVRRNGGWAAADDLAAVTVPPTIQALLAARLDRLPTSERAVIERGAVEGKVFHRGAVVELAPDDLRESVSAHLRSLSRKELVRPDRSDWVGDEAFRFRHLLIRDAAYAAMPKEARADLHARFAAWLTRVAGDHITEYEEILGYHLEQAYRYRAELGPIDEVTRRLAAQAAEHLGSAGRRALDRGDVRAALKLLQRSVDLLPVERHERHRYVAEMAWAMSLAGDLRGADQILADDLERAASQGDELGGAYAQVIRLSVQTAFGDTPIEDVIRRSEQLLAIFERHGDDWGIEGATVEAARHHFFAGRAKTAERMLRNLISANAGTDRPPSPMPFGMLLAAVFWGPTPVDEAITMLEEMGAQASRGLDSERLHALGGLRGLIGDFDPGRQLLQESLAIERDIGRIVMADLVLGDFMGPLEMAAGNNDEAERLLLDAYHSMTGRGDNAFSSTVAANLAHLYVALGRMPEAEHYADLALATSGEDDVDAQSRGTSAKALLMAARGEVEAALEICRQAVAMAERTDFLEVRGSVNADLAEIHLIAGHRQQAEAALSRAIENYDAKGATLAADRSRRRLAEIKANPG